MATTDGRRALAVVSLATTLSLFGDSAMYTVLPTHAAEAGVSLVVIGILLSANRFVRLLLNGPIGVLSDRWPRRHIFVPAVFIGALSTTGYVISYSFWPLLASRLLWGLAWAGLWVSGNAIVFDISQKQTRGKRVGVYQFAFFLGAAGGAIMGGILTDWLGYRAAMTVAASLTFTGGLAALFLLPETSTGRDVLTIVTEPNEKGKTVVERRQLSTAIALFGVNRLVVAGIFLSTFGLFLVQQFGARVTFGGLIIGATTITGLALGANTLIAMLIAPLTGLISDRLSSRWGVASGGLVSGSVGFSLLSLGYPAAMLIGLPLVSASSGSNQGMSTTLVGDLSPDIRYGRRLGVFFTVGDLGSALGPPLAYALIPAIGLNWLYRLCSALLCVMLVMAISWTRALRTAKAIAQ